MFLSRWNTLAKATTTIESSPGHTDNQQDSDDQSEHEENAKCSRERTNHVSSQSRIHTSNAAMSLKSGSTSANPSQSPYSSFNLKIAQAKHELIVTLMKEVYALFDTGESRCGRVHPPNKNRLEHSLNHPNLRLPGLVGLIKSARRIETLHRLVMVMTSEGRWTILQYQGRPFACPFRKYDPYKYTLNSNTGTTYRSCLGPGFRPISHVK